MVRLAQPHMRSPPANTSRHAHGCPRRFVGFGTPTAPYDPGTVRRGNDEQQQPRPTVVHTRSGSHTCLFFVETRRAGLDRQHHTLRVGY